MEELLRIWEILIEIVYYEAIGSNTLKNLMFATEIEIVFALFFGVSIINYIKMRLKIWRNLKLCIHISYATFGSSQTPAQK